MADAYTLMNQKLQHSLNENSNLEKAILELKVCITKQSFIFPFIVTFRFTWCTFYRLTSKGMNVNIFLPRKKLMTFENR